MVTHILRKPSYIKENIRHEIEINHWQTNATFRHSSKKHRNQERNFDHTHIIGKNWMGFAASIASFYSFNTVSCSFSNDSSKRKEFKQ